MKSPQEILDKLFWKGFDWHKSPSNKSDPDVVADQALNDLYELMSVAIGEEYEEWSESDLSELTDYEKVIRHRNLLRAEQRKRLNELFGREK